MIVIGYIGFNQFIDTIMPFIVTQGIFVWKVIIRSRVAIWGIIVENWHQNNIPYQVFYCIEYAGINSRTAP